LSAAWSPETLKLRVPTEGPFMKKQAFALLLAAAAVAPAMAQTNVGVSVSVNQPGLYGRIDIGNVPQPPALIFPQPVVIQQTPVVMQSAPIYMHVPPGHAKDWAKHCGKYGACNKRVYFVQEDWYNDHYAPRQKGGGGQGGGPKHKEKGGGGHGKGHGKD
jgi:hypothetical protein